jgi:L-threonylcarbamoyladenylate synthase
LVLRRREGTGLSDLVSAGLDTVAIRVPGHPIAQALLAAAQVPIAAPSANRSGRVSPTRAEHVAADLGGDVDLVLDGGACEMGLESTIVDCTGAAAKLLRPGAIAAEEIEKVVGQRLERPAASAAAPTSPGQLASHYAPAAKVRLNVERPEPGEAVLAFGPQVPKYDGPMLNLSETGDLREAAANLFASLRELDKSGVSTIAVMPIPNRGLGEAINDRLARAAAPRP